MPHYPVSFLILISLIGPLFIVVGLLVAMRLPNDNPALLFHFIMICAAVIVMATGGRYPLPIPGLSHVVRGAFAAAYALLPVLLTSPTLDGPACGRCDPRSVLLGIDRAVLGNRSRAAAITSDVLLGGLVLGALTTPLWELTAENTDSRGAATDFVVALEAIGLTFAITQLLKLTVRRARPYSYDTSLPLSQRSARPASLSFFSGHASLAFSAAVAQSYTFWRRHPGGAGGYVVLSATLAAATTTAMMRVLAGKHYWTDVIVGAMVGGLIGLLLPVLRDDGAGDDTAATIQLPQQRAPVFSLGARF